jgi:hypothetical protein
MGVPAYVPASYRNLTRRGRLARWSLFLATLAWIASVALLGWEIHLINQAQAGQATEQDFLTAMERENLLFGIRLLLVLASAVFFVLWFHRAYKNLDALGGERRYRTGWAIWSWLLPPFQAFLPPLIAVDIWNGSDPHIRRATGWGVGVVWWWWAMGAAGLAVGAKAQVVIHSAATLDDAKWGGELMFVATALVVASGINAMRLIGDVTHREEARARAIGRAAVRASLERHLPVEA